MAQRMEHWPIERLIPYARNARTHSDAQVAQIAASIVEFGFNNPVLVDSKAGIICVPRAPSGSSEATQLAEVPVIVLDHLNEAQKRAYILADNRLAELAGWNEEILRIELEALRDVEFNYQLTGFDEKELARLVKCALGSNRATNSR